MLSIESNLDSTPRHSCQPNRISFGYSRKKQIVEEREKVLTNALEMRKKLESSQDELEKAKIKQLEEKLASIRRKYGEMKIHLVSLKLT